MPDEHAMGAFQIRNEQDSACGFCIIRVELDDAGLPADWTFIHVNETLADFEGRRVDELIGHRYFELFPQRSRKRLQPHFEAAYEGRNVSFDDVSYELGKIVHVDVFPTGERGCCACVLSDIRDIEFEMDRQADVIKALATIYTTIVEDNLITHRYRVIKSVDLMNTVTGGKAEGDLDMLVDALMEYFVHPDMRGEMRDFTDLNNVAVRMAESNTFVTEFKTPAGAYFEARFIASKRNAAGQVETVLFAARDISREKQREMNYREQLKEAAVEAERANVSKTNFLRRMSHDIRTPLNGIVGMLRIMNRNKGDEAKYEDCLGKIMCSTDYLLGIVNNVLDIGKMESGSIELENKPFDLVQLLLDTLPMIATNAAQHSIAFYGGIERIKAEHRYVIGSPIHLNRVLMNLASNAVKYNRPGGSLKLNCNELSCDGERAVYEFICEDTGLGMSEEFQKHAFEPFAQEGKQTITNFSGSGLGLAIVREIVTRMGGTVELHSRENVGTTMRIVLTFSLDKHHDAAITKENLPDTIDLSGRSALLVEDNGINMEIAAIMLEEMGLTVTCATNGQEAVNIFCTAQPYTYDFIFMDVMMPVLDGLEATQTIRTLSREDAKSVPIIAMTANAFAEDRQACLDAGMNDHIGKPVETVEVVRVLLKYAK